MTSSSSLRSQLTTAFALAGACLSLQTISVTAASAGPGDTIINNQDGAFDLTMVDLTNPVTLPPGTYKATQFNYQFGPDSTTKGTVTPMLVIGSVPSFTAVAIGTAIGDLDNFIAPTSFLSAPFGGSDTFTLGGPTTVYGALYWDAKDIGSPAMPVGYLGNVGDSYIFYRGSPAPALGGSLSGPNEGEFSRTYDFNVEIEAVNVPDFGSTITLLSLGLFGLAYAANRRFHP